MPNDPLNIYCAYQFNEPSCQSHELRTIATPSYKEKKEKRKEGRREGKRKEEGKNWYCVVKLEFEPNQQHQN